MFVDGRLWGLVSTDEPIVLNDLDGDVTIEPRKKGYEFAPTTTVMTPDHAEIRFTVESFAARQDVPVELVDIDGAPVASAVVWANAEQEIGVTDGSGSVLLQAIPVGTELSVTYRDFLIEPNRIIVNENLGIAHFGIVEKIVDYTAKVLFLDGHLPIINGIRLFVDDHLWGILDSEEQISITHRVGDVMVRPEKDGYAFVPEMVTVNAAEPNARFAIERPATSKDVSVEVRTTAGQAVTSAKIFVDGVQAISTDGQGNARLNDVAIGSVITGQKGDLVFEPDEIVVNQHLQTAYFTVVEPVLEPDTYSGSVRFLLDSSLQLEDVQLFIGEYLYDVVTTDDPTPLGEFDSDAVITPRKAGYEFIPASVKISHARKEARFTVEPYAEVQDVLVQVVDSNGDPLPTARVWANNSMELSTTDGNGEVALRRIPRGTELTVTYQDWIFEPDRIIVNEHLNIAFFRPVPSP